MFLDFETISMLAAAAILTVMCVITLVHTHIG